MRSWHSKLILPADYREQEYLSKGQRAGLWPTCPRCSKEQGTEVEVTAYGVKDYGKLPGESGEHYTDFFARCHGEEDIIRIEGFRWDKSVLDNVDGGEFTSENIARLAAVKALPFFYGGSEAGRCIPAAVFKNFLASQRASTL